MKKGTETVHVIIPGFELAGKGEYIESCRLLLKKAVKIAYGVGQVGAKMRYMNSIEKDPDYKGGNVILHTGPGMIVLPMSDDGELMKQYLKTIGEAPVNKEGTSDKNQVHESRIIQ